MRSKIFLAGLSVALLVGAAVAATGDNPEMPEMPKPQKEHEWLRQLAGEWNAEVEIYMDPSGEPAKSTGTESTRMLGGFWAVSEFKGTMMGSPFNGILTIGYVPAEKNYVATWVDSMSNYMWQYEGELDESGKVLTLTTEGPSCMDPTTTAEYKETIELKSKDHKVFTSRVKGEDGEWMPMMKVNYRRAIQPSSGKE